MQDNMIRGCRIWFFTNLFGSLLLLCVTQTFDAEEADIFAIICLIGAVVSLLSIYFSAVSIRLLKDLAPNTGIRLRFMFKATAGVVVFVLVTIDLIFHGILGMFLGVLLILTPHIIMAFASSIYVNRDLIFIYQPDMISSTENTEL